MAAAARIANSEDTMRALHWVRTEGKHLQLGVAEYNSFLHPFAVRGELTGAMYVFDDMTRQGIQGDEATHQRLLYACGRAGQADLGLSLLEHVRTQAEVRVNRASDPQAAAAASLSGSAEASPSSASPSPSSASDAQQASPSSSPGYLLPSSLFDALIGGLLVERSDSPPPMSALTASHSILHRQRAYHAQGVAPPPSLSTYAALINAYRRSAQSGPAYQLYVEMRTEGHLLPTADFNALLTLIGQQSEDGLRLSLSLIKERIEAYKAAGGDAVEVSTFNTLIPLCRRWEKLEHLSSLLEQMAALGVDKDLSTYNHLIDSYGAYDVSRVLTLYHSLLASKLQPDLHTFHLLLSVASDDHRLVWAILQDLARAGVAPQEKTFLIALASAERKDKAGRWLLPFFHSLNSAAAAHSEREKNAANISPSIAASLSLRTPPPCPET